VYGCHPANAADKAGVAHIRTEVTDANNVMGCVDVKASKMPQGRVVESGGVEFERARSDSRVWAALGVSKKRTLTDGRVGKALVKLGAA